MNSKYFVPVIGTDDRPFANVGNDRGEKEREIQSETDARSPSRSSEDSERTFPPLASFLSSPREGDNCTRTAIAANTIGSCCFRSRATKERRTIRPRRGLFQRGDLISAELRRPNASVRASKLKEERGTPAFEWRGFREALSENICPRRSLEPRLLLRVTIRAPRDHFIVPRPRYERPSDDATVLGHRDRSFIFPRNVQETWRSLSIRLRESRSSSLDQEILRKLFLYPPNNPPWLCHLRRHVYFLSKRRGDVDSRYDCISKKFA